MNKLKFYYEFRVRLIDFSSDELEYILPEPKKFENENPIIARQEAISFFQNYIGVLLEDKKGIDYSEKEDYRKTRAKLLYNFSEISFLENNIDLERLETLYFDDCNEGKSGSIYGIGIYLVYEEDVTEDFEDGLIYGIGLSRALYDPQAIMDGLDFEMEIYEKYNLETQNLIQSVDFWDSQEIKTHKILRIPFDWRGCDKPDRGIHYIKNKEEEHILTYEEMIENDEGTQIEFKPTFIGQTEYIENGKQIKRNYEFEMAKTLCAFLNAKGGFLFIGVSKKKEIKGIDFSKISKDDFKREFVRVKKWFFPKHFISFIEGDFYESSGKEIFVIKTPTSKEPVFLQKDKENKDIKSFYVRDASESTYYDVENAVKYCQKRFFTNKEE